MFSSVLMVCTGNICRSPMAEYLLKDRWQRSGVVVGSAGTAALVNHPADDEAMTVMQDHGVDMRSHRARQLQSQLVAEHELILTMESHHARWLMSRFPTARGRVYAVTHWVPNHDQVPDPYCQGRRAFERTWDILVPAIDSWVERLAGP